LIAFLARVTRNRPSSIEYGLVVCSQSPLFCSVLLRISLAFSNTALMFSQ
jgi:hypothetical protein